MASTSTFQPDPDGQPIARDTPLKRGFGRSRGHSKRASKRGLKHREKLASRLEVSNTGLPQWDGLKPVFLFLLIPAFLVLMVVATGGEWPPELLYSLAAVLGIYLFASTLHSVELVLACTLLYLPFASSYVIPIAPGVNGTNMLLLLGLFASILRAGSKRDGWFSWMPGSTAVAAFALVSCLSGPTMILTQPGGWAYLLYGEVLSYKAWIDQFLLYFIALSCIRDTETAKRMVVYMGLGAIVLVIYAVPEMLEKAGRSTIEKSRLEGPHRQSNNFGGFVAYSVLPLVAIFVSYIKDIRFWLFTPYFLLAAKVLITTFSRGAYLAMAVGAFLAGYFKGRSFLFLWAMFALSFFLVFPQLIPDAIVDRMSTITEEKISTAAPDELDKSSANRLVLWRAAGKMIIEDPFAGKGFKGFQKLKADYTELPVKESDPHSMYLYIASQMGLPALGLYLVIIGYSFFLGRALSRDREDRFIRAIGIGGAASTACYAVICAFGSRAVNLEFTAYFWTYLVCMQVIFHQRRVAVVAKLPKRRRTNAYETQKLAHEKTERLEQVADDQPKLAAFDSTPGATPSGPTPPRQRQLPQPATRRSQHNEPADHPGTEEDRDLIPRGPGRRHRQSDNELALGQERARRRRLKTRL